MPLTTEQLHNLRDAIAARRRVLEVELQEVTARSRTESYSELAGEVHDAAEEAVADLIADLDNAELSRDLRELRGLQAANARLAAGSYGTCIDCDEQIPFPRLQAEPGAVRCIECQRRREHTFAPREGG